VVKESPFVDGNKRIGSFLFVWLLEKGKLRFDQTGEVKINANGLVALTLMVDLSKLEEREVMIELIKNLIA
jgi:prophage maintenance system killer protein